MSRSGQSADVGGREAAEALRDPIAAQLMRVCGEHIELVTDVALQAVCNRGRRLEFLKRQLSEQYLNNVYLWNRPIELALQSRYADCRCSPFGRLMRRNVVISGSAAEGIANPRRPPKYETASDVDTMIEVGAVHWKLPGTEETSPAVDTAAEPTTAATAQPSDEDGDQTPQLVIVETENPGFVLVLQERRDDCPHQDTRPFKAEAVIEVFRDYQKIISVDSIKQRSIHGPACSYAIPSSGTSRFDDYDDVPCLHVPVWWFSDEFFTRHRRYNWPPKAVRDDIKRYGLHLVPVGAPGSIAEKIQWRLSFSRAETVIISQLTELQRSAVINFKMCKRALGEEGKVIKSLLYQNSAVMAVRANTDRRLDERHPVLSKDAGLLGSFLPCFFWSRMNLLRFTSRSDRKAMKRVLGKIRQHRMKLLAHETRTLCPELQRMLTKEAKQLSERQLRACLTRWLIAMGIRNIITAYMALSTTNNLHELRPVLVRSYAPDEVKSLLRSCSHQHEVQTWLSRALTVAPADVASQVWLSASGDGFVLDVAPLLGLLTESELKDVLGDPDAVRVWLRSQHQLPVTERPAMTLTADLRSPRDLCDLLIDIPLATRALKESVPDKWARYEKWARTLKDVKLSVRPAERQATLSNSKHWRGLAVRLQSKLGMDRQTALRMACRVGVELRQLCDDPKTLVEHNRMVRSVSDPWRLKHYSLVGSP